MVAQNNTSDLVASTLERALALRREIDEHNRQAQREQAHYERYIEELAVLGLTPENVDEAIASLESEIEELAREINLELDETERKITNAKPRSSS